MDLISGTATIELAALNPPFTGAPLMTNKGSASLNDDTPLMETFALDPDPVTETPGIRLSWSARSIAGFKFSTLFFDMSLVEAEPADADFEELQEITKSSKKAQKAK